jgi:hypothetical protein
MTGCPQHDWVDYLAALGPTLATIFAGVATVHVYLRSERFQKQLVRPLIVVRQQISIGEPFAQWKIEVRNEGAGAANIESCVVIADGDIVPYEPLEGPSAYWSFVLLKLGTLRVQKIDGNVLLTPCSIGAGASHLLFHAHIAGQSAAIEALARKLEIKGAFTSSFGERKSFRSRFGRDDRKPAT